METRNIKLAVYKTLDLIEKDFPSDTQCQREGCANLAIGGIYFPDGYHATEDLVITYFLQCREHILSTPDDQIIH